MATTSLWEIHQRLDKVIDYTTNIEKTRNKEYARDLYLNLHNVIEYAKSDFKTEQQYYVTAINCNEETAFKEMIITKKHFGKENGILAYHGFQSFAEGEVTPEKAHEIGIKLAEELWGDRFEVLVSTHINTKHIHNHFVLNSVSFVDGKKYRKDRRTYALMRTTSDDICRENNLSVIEEKPCGKLQVDYTKYFKSFVQKTDYYTIVKDDIDFAIKQAYSYNNFENILKEMGYSVITRTTNQLSLCRPPHKRNIRIARAFGEEYTIDNIEKRILNSEMYFVPFPKAYSKYRRYNKTYKKKNNFSIKKDRGKLYRLYMYYCYLLKVFPNNKNRVKLSAEMKKESKKMEEISNEIKFLCRNEIKTTEELYIYKENVTEELKKILKERTSLRRKVKTNQSLYDEILVLSDKINFLKSEVRLCEKIEERKNQMKENIRKIELKENEGKEREENEHSR